VIPTSKPMMSTVTRATTKIHPPKAKNMVIRRRKMAFRMLRDPLLRSLSRPSKVSEQSFVLLPPRLTILHAARPFKRVKVPSGAAPHFNGDGPSDYIFLDGLPPNHHCSACDEVHPMGWCRLKVASVEHCGLCGIAHIGHGRTCPHLNSEVQVATLLGTLKESMESRDLVEQARRYLRMIRGDLVQKKRSQENKQQEQQQEAQAAGGMVSGPSGTANGAGSVSGSYNQDERSMMHNLPYLGPVFRHEPPRFNR